MLTLLVRFTPEMELPRGAHLIVHHLGYQHHGIYVGEGRVVHYSGFSTFLSHGPVKECSLKSFTTGHRVSLKPSDGGAFAADQVVARACSRLGEDRYSLFTNNCEHFCEWCINGISRSEQVESIKSVMKLFLKPIGACLRAIQPRHVAFSKGVTTSLNH